MVIAWNRRAILVFAILLFATTLVYLQNTRRYLSASSASAGDDEVKIHHGFAEPPPPEERPPLPTKAANADGNNDEAHDDHLGMHSPTAENSPASPSPTYSKGVVMGRLNEDKFNTDWVNDLEDWQNFIYIVDLEEGKNSSTGYRTRMNRAHEAMPYLTYIVEHYPDFPDIVAFVHPHRGGPGAHDSAWHTDVPHNDAVTMLRLLRAETVARQGYVNLRCIDVLPGCPDEVQPWRDPPDIEKTAEHVFPYYYASMFNISLSQVRAQASVVAQPCCAQFAVSKQQILARPKAQYEHFVNLLENTVQDGHEDETAGRVMEYMWHIIFGREHVFCPRAVDCYCDVYGRFCP